MPEGINQRLVKKVILFLVQKLNKNENKTTFQSFKNSLALKLKLETNFEQKQADLEINKIQQK